MDHCYRQDYANVHRGIHTLSERMTTQYEEARQKVQQWLGARSAREIIFTGGTTAAINLVAHSFGAGLQAGDEIILSIMEHHSNIVPWQQLAARQGVILRWVGLQEDGTLDLEQFLQCLGPRTKLVAITMVSNVLGLINPVESLIQWSHAAGAKVLLDAAQAAPHLPVQVQALDCDFLVFSGHKVLGPTGIGVLYGREELLEQLPPFLGGGSMIDRVEIDGFSPAELPAKFEAGTPPIVEAIGLAAAIDYLSAIGMDQIDAHERGLARQCLDGLADLPGLRILGPSSGPRVGLVSLAVEGINSQDLARFLDFRGFAARAGHHCAMPLHQSLGLSNSLRVSFYLYNTAEEVAQFTELLPQLLERLR
jgi:cysteine desulfurase/selenocysteine lyase